MLDIKRIIINHLQCDKGVMIVKEMKPEALEVKHQTYTCVCVQRKRVQICVCVRRYIYYIYYKYIYKTHWYTVEANMIFVKKVHKC